MVVIDLVWASVSGVGVGAILGIAIGYVVQRLRKLNISSEYTDDFLSLGLIALAYGLALLFKGYGFLAVFVAGYALQQTEFYLTKHNRPSKDELKAIKNSELMAAHLKKGLHLSGFPAF